MQKLLVEPATLLIVHAIRAFLAQWAVLAALVGPQVGTGVGYALW